MLLTIDTGNTKLTLGLYDGNNLFAHWRLATDHARMPDEYGLQFQGLLQNAKQTAKNLTGICLASVVPQLSARVVQACREYLDLEPFGRFSVPAWAGGANFAGLLTLGVFGVGGGAVLARWALRTYGSAADIIERVLIRTGTLFLALALWLHRIVIDRIYLHGGAYRR